MAAATATAEIPQVRQFEARAQRQPELVSVNPDAARQQKPMQGTLFTARDIRPADTVNAKVVSLDDFREPARRPRRKTAPRTRPVGRTLAPAEVELQRNLFTEQEDVMPAASSMPVVDSGLHKDAWVAPIAQRVTAVVIDAAMIALAEGLLLAGLVLSPAAPYLTRGVLAGLAAFGLMLAFGYKLLFALAETDSPGTRWAHLKVLNFDGAAPTRHQRISRLVGGILSAVSAGLGLLWAMVDEETLSWHDHISKTFASPDFGPRTR